MTANQFAESLAAAASNHNRDQRDGEQHDGEPGATSSAGRCQDGALIIDVRPQEQFQMASIPGATIDVGHAEGRAAKQTHQCAS